jgi:hypothetical protein
MLKFSQYIEEARKKQKKTAVLFFGRMNPLTRGHEKGVQAASKIAKIHDADLHVVASRSHDPEKNPLSPSQKSRYLKTAFPDSNASVASSRNPSFMHQARRLHKKGYQHLVVVGGSDRAQHYHDLLNKYNGKEYNFKSIKIVSAGERKAKSSGVEGASGTSMRQYAQSDTFSKFRENLPSRISHDPDTAHRIFRDTQRGMKK